MLAKAMPNGIILREKDLPEEEYKSIALSAMKICEKYGTECILHTFHGVAKELGCKSFHAPLHVLESMSEDQRKTFSSLGTSCHSVEDATVAENLGCTYITLGHIFQTECKKGLPGRGTDLLKTVCEKVKIPVYAIGGISAGNIGQIKDAGAKGGCIMSSCMTCSNPKMLLEELR